jgi:CRP/FNR family cyclic AMP-dependent transcriptional regulator
MSLKDRFTPEVLLNCMELQELAAGAYQGAKELAGAVTELIELKPGATLISEGDNEEALYFILAGKLQITIKGDKIDYRGVGTHVGEMALVLTSLRTATVRAYEPSVVGRVEGTVFREIANRHPKIWENTARVLAQRLDYRKRFIRDPNPRPFIFIGSSGEQADVANSIKDGLNCPDVDCEVWNEPDVFPHGDSFLDTILHKARKSDFAILIFGRDDKTISRGTKRFSPRDNVVFEAGMFMGSIGKKRTFVVTDRKSKLKMLSDLDGIKVLGFEKSKSWWQKKSTINVDSCCNTISKIINDSRIP